MEGFRSDEEYYFSAWCHELKRSGYIKDFFYEQDKWELFPKQKCGGRSIREATYTADFTIIWIARPPFVYNINDPKNRTAVMLQRNGVSYVDVKGSGYSGKFNNSDVMFPLIQKILLSRNIFINKFIVSNKKNSGFDKSFTPQEYLFTPTGKPKVLHYTPRCITDIV